MNSEVWKLVFRECFGGHGIRYHEEVLPLLIAVDQGIKPAFLWDVSAPDTNCLLSLLLLASQKELISHNLKVIEVDLDVFIINKPVVIRVLTNFLMTDSSWLIDISRSEPKIANKEIHLTLRNHLISILLQLGIPESKLKQFTCPSNNEIPSSEGSALPVDIPPVNYELETSGASNQDQVTRQITVKLSKDVNLSTIFGCILGYPQVYWWEGESGGISLSGVPLKVFKFESLFNPRSDLIELFSFSIPESLERELRPGIEHWGNETNVWVQKSSFYSEAKFHCNSVLCLIGKPREALGYSLDALKVCRQDPKAQALVASLTNSLVERWHLSMIGDEKRNSTFNVAIQKCVVDGYKNVLDIGAGSGLLSIYAQRAGASQVYACELDSFMCELCENVLQTNLKLPNFQLLKCHSSDIEIGTQLPERVSLLVTETFDAGLFGEHILPTLSYAWKNLLLPPGQVKVLPSHAKIYVALLQADYIQRQTKAELRIQNKSLKLDLQLGEPYLSEKMNHIPGFWTLLTEWKNVLSIDFNSQEQIDKILNGEVKETIEFILEKPGRVDGLIFSYKLILQDNSLDTFPTTQTCWENAIYPFFSMKIFNVGDQFSVDMTYDEVLRFSLHEITNPNLLQQMNSEDSHSLTTTDDSLLKMVNSDSLKKFFIDQIENGFCESNLPLNVLDTCEFPVGGLAFLQQDSRNKLYVMNKEAYKILNKLGIDVAMATEIERKINVLIYWPFGPLGTLKENFMQELAELRHLLDEGGRVLPEFLNILMVAFESPQIATLTRVSDKMTCGVKVAQIFDLIKTQHHMDIPIENISHKPLTRVILALTFSLNHPEDSFINFSGISEEGSEDYLVVGSKVWRRILPVIALETGSVDGIAYWFELMGPSRELQEGAGLATGTHQTHDRKQFEKTELNSIPLQAGRSFNVSTLAIDSPINQCLLMLDQPFPVVANNLLQLHFAISGGHISVHLSN